MAEPKQHFDGKVKYLILQGNLHVSDLDSHRVPLHVSIAHLLGAVNLEIAKRISEAAPEVMPTLANELLGRAVLGGYARLVSDNPPIYKHVKGSSSVPPATEDEFNAAQNSGNITFNKFTSHDASEVINR